MNEKQSVHTIKYNIITAQRRQQWVPVHTLSENRARGGGEWKQLTAGLLCCHRDCLCIESIEKRFFAHFH